VAIVADGTVEAGVAGVAGVIMLCTPDAAPVKRFLAALKLFVPICATPENIDPNLPTNVGGAC
jgi:hypothetical protein